MEILKKLRWKISILLSIVLVISNYILPKVSFIYTQENLSTDFYDKCAQLIKDNWNENYNEEVKSADIEFQTMRLIVKAKHSNLDVSKYNAKDIVKSNDNIIVLQFDTVEKTKKAYDDLTLSNNIEYVEVDKIIELEYKSEEVINQDEVSTSDYSSSRTYNSWGVKRIEADQYSQYLYNQGIFI